MAKNCGLYNGLIPTTTKEDKFNTKETLLAAIDRIKDSIDFSDTFSAVYESTYLIGNELAQDEFTIRLDKITEVLSNDDDILAFALALNGIREEVAAL